MFVALEYPCERSHVFGTDGYEAAVEVAPLDLDHPDIPAQDLALRSVQALEAGKVYRYRAPPGAAGARLSRPKSGSLDSLGRSWSTGTA